MWSLYLSCVISHFWSLDVSLPLLTPVISVHLFLSDTQLTSCLAAYHLPFVAAVC